MGRMSRTKGRAYEQHVARVLRSRFDVDVRRSSQADRAGQSDIYVVDGPPVLKRIWWELNDARRPQPTLKLVQAEWDIHRLPEPDRDRLPVVVWHRIREQASHATTWLWVIDTLRGTETVDRTVVTLTLDNFLDMLGRVSS